MSPEDRPDVDIYSLLARAERDPAFRAMIVAALTDEDREAMTRIVADALQNAPDVEVRRQAAAMMFQRDAGSQNIGGQ